MYIYNHVRTCIYIISFYIIFVEPFDSNKKKCFNSSKKHARSFRFAEKTTTKKQLHIL